MCAESEDDDELADRYSDSRCCGGTMYGMLLESIQHYIQQLHGPGSWDKVLEHAGLKNVVFTTHRRYRDDIMIKLAHSLVLVMHDRSVDSYMEYFGQCFVQYWTHYGYDTIMRASGRHYRDFLHGIDNLHETMRFSYPKMLTPSFYVDKEDCHGCLLHYRSKRVGFTYYVIGQLRQSGRKFYNVDVDIDVIEVNEMEKGVHIVYCLKFDNSVYRPAEIEKALYPGVLEFPSLTVKEFFKAFPFSMVFNKEMQIVHVGRTTQELLGGSTLIGTKVMDKFNLRRPRMEFTWDNVICLQRVVFELLSVDPVRLRPRDGSKETKKYSERHLLLKGQMRYIPDLQGIAFLGTPLLNNLEELLSMGLYINELNMYDGSRDMVMAGWQHASKLESLIEQQVEKCRLIAENMRQLDAWRQNSESLLYSMLPQQIADRLRNGEDPVSTCEMFNEVTILFSYTLGFHEMCANTPATELVECINNIFITFDAVVEKHNVFKVETLGDAVYMVAGGVPERRANHAANVASVGLELIEKVQDMHCPCAINAPLQIRLGMHTGSIVAGVVGKRMPQYCLFGDTVNTAARMQTNSEPGQIHISESCQRCLQDSEFVTVFRGSMHVKGKGKMCTYWLAGRKSDPSIDEICAQLQQCHKPATKCLSSDTFDLRKGHKKSEINLVSSDSSLASPPPLASDSPQLPLKGSQEIPTEEQEYISFSTRHDASSVSSVASSLSRSDSYMSIQEMLRQHSRRCSTGELNMTFRPSRRSARRQSESMLAFRVCPDTRDPLDPARPVFHMTQNNNSDMTQNNMCDMTRNNNSDMTQNNMCDITQNDMCDMTQNNMCDMTQNGKSDASPTVPRRDNSDKSSIARRQIKEWKEKAALEKERQRRELDDLVESLPVPLNRCKTLGAGSCPFSQMVQSNDSNDAFKELNHGDQVIGVSDEPCRPSNTDQEVPVCPASGFMSGQCKSTHGSSRVRNSLVHAITRSVLSPSRDDCWNSVMCANSSEASSQEVSSDEDMPPLIHHEHINFTSPLVGKHINYTSPQVSQHAWPASKGNAMTSEQRHHLTNGVCMSPNDAGDTWNDTDSHNLSDTNLMSVNDNIQHSSDSSFSPNAHNFSVVGCPVVHDIRHSCSNCALTSCTDVLTDLDHNGSIVRPYLRTRSNTISTAHGHARRLLQRRHSASGKLSQCRSQMYDGRQLLGNKSFSESEADLMSFSSVSDIRTCCLTVDGGLDGVNRNLLDTSLPELHYQSLLETDFRTNSPPHISAPSVA